MSDRPMNIEETKGIASEQAAVAKIMDEIFSHRGAVGDCKESIPGSKGHESVNNLPRAGDNNTLDESDLKKMRPIPLPVEESFKEKMGNRSEGKLPHVVLEGFGIMIFDGDPPSKKSGSGHFFQKLEPRDQKPILK